jgi:hypothetical protein
MEAVRSKGAPMKPTFTLRDLFWLVLVCAIGMAWIVSQSDFGGLLVQASIMLGLSAFWFTVGFTAGVTVRGNP